MIIYIAAEHSLGDTDPDVVSKKEKFKINTGTRGRLLSFHYIQKTKANQEIFSFYKKRRGKKMINLFLDSGAFSAFTKKVEIDIQEYIKYIKENKKYINLYANLDVIGDAEGTLKNQKIMEKAGLSPIPCFHAGEDFSYLDHYIKNYDYISLGGVAQLGRRAGVWMEDCFDRICGDDGIPRVKVHGFAVTSLKLMMRFPWYSVDSTSWVMTSRMGSVYVPIFRNGEYIYDENSWKVCVSEKSPNVKDAGKHITTFAPQARDVICNYFKLKGFTLEELASDYMKRDELNIIYFNDLEKTFPEWPWAYKRSKVRSLF